MLRRITRRVLETWRTRKTKKEHELYLEEHGIHPVQRLREHTERVDPEWSAEIWRTIEELHKKNIGALRYKPDKEDLQRIERIAQELHERIAEPGIDEREWLAIVAGLQRYEEPYNALGKKLTELWRRAKK